MLEVNGPEPIHIDAGVDPRGRRAVEQLLSDAICHAVDYRASTASTNSLALTELLNHSSAELPSPKLFLTDRQTAGRGRHGRRWHSSDATLTFSLVIPRPAAEQRSGQLAPLAVGLGIARFLEFEFAPLNVRLKWPNDVHIGGGKVAGILMETSSARTDRLVIGVGVNVSEAPKAELLEQPQVARSLAEVSGRQLHRYELLPGLVTHILEAMASARTETEPSLDEFRQRCLLDGQRVSFRDRGELCEGWCRGISADGALMVETEAGVKYLQSGEANLIRPRSV